jgi:hypothetical protein
MRRISSPGFVPIKPNMTLPSNLISAKTALILLGAFLLAPATLPGKLKQGLI